MRNVWATVLSVWALFAMVAVLAWTRQQPVAPQQPVPQAVVVKGKNGKSSLVVVPSGTATHATTRTSPGGGRMMAVAASGMPVAWIVARAAGLVAFGLLTISVSLGLALSTRVLGNRRGKMLMAWHQTLMWTALSMLVLHGRGAPARPDPAFRAPRRASSRGSPVASGQRRGRDPRWMVHAHPRGLVPRPAPDRTTPLAAPSLREFRGVLSRSGPRVDDRHRPHRNARHDLRRSGGGARPLAHVRADPDAESSGAAARARHRRPFARHGPREMRPNPSPGTANPNRWRPDGRPARAGTVPRDGHHVQRRRHRRRPGCCAGPAGRSRPRVPRSPPVSERFRDSCPRASCRA